MLAKAFEPSFVLQFNEFLIVETSMVDRHVEVKAVRAGMASESEVASTMRL